MSSIERTGKTWNPIVGCSKISAGCQNCYAINQAYRNAAIGKTMDNPGRLAYYEGLTEKRGNRADNGIDFFLKQLGSKCYGLNHGYTGKRTNPDEWPEGLRVRQMPSVEVTA